MDKEYILSTAEIIRKQLLATTNINVVLSWGIEHIVATTKNGMAALKFDVRGRLHRGQVVIVYDNICDTYQIFLIDATGVDRCITDCAYFDNMVKIIDDAIEVGSDMEEYLSFCEGEFHKLLNGEFI